MEVRRLQEIYKNSILRSIITLSNLMQCWLRLLRPMITKSVQILIFIGKVWECWLRLLPLAANPAGERHM